MIGPGIAVYKCQSCGQSFDGITLHAGEDSLAKTFSISDHADLTIRPYSEFKIHQCSPKMSGVGRLVGVKVVEEGGGA